MKTQVKRPISLLLLVLALLMVLASLVLPAASAWAKPYDKPVNSKSYVLMDADTGQILSSKEPNLQVYPASTTKIMTVLLLLESGKDLSQLVTIDLELRSGSVMGLKKGEKVSYKDLMYAAMLVSANDAAANIAVSVGGSGEKFIEMMNEKAQALGMKNTKFVNTHGLQDEEHYTTASDMAILARAAMQIPAFVECVKTSKYTMTTGPKKELETTNKLLSKKEDDIKFNYAPTTGMKTGSTPAAGGCFVATANKEGRNLIVVIMGDTSATSAAGDSPDRWPNTKALFEYGFSLQYEDITSKIQNVTLETKDIPQAHSASVMLSPVISGEKITYAGESDDIAALNQGTVTAEIVLDEGISAPLAAGTEVGTVVYKLGEEELYSTRVQTVNAVANVTTPAAAATSEEGKLKKRPFIIAAMSVVLVILLFVIFRIIITSKRRRAVHATQVSPESRMHAKRHLEHQQRQAAERQHRPTQRRRPPAQRQNRDLYFEANDPRRKRVYRERDFPEKERSNINRYDEEYRPTRRPRDS